MKNIILIGFMGSGKTVVGLELAKKMGLKFIDTDALIEARVNKSITDIFAKHGEAKFRKLESQIIKEVAALKNHVISVGGGAVVKEMNLKALKENGILIYLKSDFKVLYDRIKESPNRPLIAVERPKEEMRLLFESRQKVYQEASDYVVGSNEGTPVEIADKIIKDIHEKI